MGLSCSWLGRVILVEVGANYLEDVLGGWLMLLGYLF